MIRNGYARRLQAQVEQSRLTEQWQGYPQAVRQALQAILRDHGLMAAQCATEALAAYATSSEALKEVQDAGSVLHEKRMARRGSDLKGRYQYFPLPSLLAQEHSLVVDTDFEMVHLIRQSSFVLSQRWNDVELAILLPLLRAWPAPASYKTLYESLCLASWQGTIREFRHALPALLNNCVQRFSSLGMEIIVDGSSLLLVSFA